MRGGDWVEGSNFCGEKRIPGNECRLGSRDNRWSIGTKKVIPYHKKVSARAV